MRADHADPAAPRAPATPAGQCPARDPITGIRCTLERGHTTAHQPGGTYVPPPATPEGGGATWSCTTCGWTGDEDAAHEHARQHPTHMVGRLITTIEYDDEAETITYHRPAPAEPPAAGDAYSDSNAAMFLRIAEAMESGDWGPARHFSEAITRLRALADALGTITPEMLTTMDAVARLTAAASTRAGGPAEGIVAPTLRAVHDLLSALAGAPRRVGGGQEP